MRKKSLILQAIAVLLMLVAFKPTLAVIPPTLNYQAYLTDDNGLPIDGTADVTVSIYNVEIGGYIERIMLDHVDAKRLPYDDQSFSVVISNSIVHHIADPIVVLREANRVAAQDGLLFFRDLLRPNSDAEVAELVASYAGDANPHQQQMFEDSLRAALSLEEIRSAVEQLGFDPGTVTATSDRHWTWIGKK